MKIDDVLQLLLAAADERDTKYSYRDVEQWPEGALERFQSLGLVRQAAGSNLALCPNCDDEHIEGVVYSRGFDGGQRLSICCPEAMEVEVTPEMCRWWEVDQAGFAMAMAGSLGMCSTPTELYPGRLWRLGRIPWKGKTREVLYARGLIWNDCLAVMRKVPPAGKSMVLVPANVPDERHWPNRVPVVISLSEYMLFKGGQLASDAARLMETIEEIDGFIQEQGQVPLDVVAKKKVEMAVDQCIRKRLTPADVIEAVIRFGGVDRARKALLAESSQVPSRATIYRWIEDRGGMEILRDKSDWGSMVSLKTSHPGDRGRKFQQTRS